MFINNTAHRYHAEKACSIITIQPYPCLSTRRSVSCQMALMVACFLGAASGVPLEVRCVVLSVDDLFVAN